jgi:probable HAF family extracellular repeat protein
MPVSLTTTVVGNAPVTGLSEALDLNDAGVVVGQEDTVFPFIWRPTSPNGTSGTSTRLPSLPHPLQQTGVATAVNNAGDVVGFCDTTDAGGTTVTHAVLWQGGVGPAIDLNTLVPNPFSLGTFLGESKARGINDNGFIVGVSDSLSGVPHAFLFDPAVGVMRDLGSLVPPPGTGSSQANAIANNGSVVGTSAAIDSQGNSVDRAFLLLGGGLFMSDLGTLIPDPVVPGAFSGNSSAIAINTGGLIAGDSDTSALPGSSTGAFFSLGAPPVGMFPAQMTISDCNDNDHVVGSFTVGVGTAFRFAAGGAPIDLSGVFPGHSVTKAVAINNHGQIAAIANDGTNDKAILLTP